MIFQDESSTFSAPMISHAPMPSAPKVSRRVLGDVQSNQTLNPPATHNQNFSPLKNMSLPPTRPPGAPTKGHFSSLSMTTNFVNGPSNTDSLQKRPQLSKFKTSSHKKHHSSGSTDLGKENFHSHIFQAPYEVNFSTSAFPSKPHGKRILLDAAPISEARPMKKAKRENSSSQELQPIASSTPVHAGDDGAKPPHSYAQLIASAILQSPHKRLTLAQIYKWISDHYAFYRTNESGWQNSIRHNLSLHKNFQKVDRPKDDPGKGHYWTVEPGCEEQFLKEKPVRKAVATAENLPVMSTRLEPSCPTIIQFHEATFPENSSTSQCPSHVQISALPNISSEATIPGSDPMEPSWVSDEVADEPELLEQTPASPLPTTIQSSPPVPRRKAAGGSTPPCNRQEMPPSASKQSAHHRATAAIDDSGYISSLESSAMRPNATSVILTSEADQPRVKGGRKKAGRAEEEIKRMRSRSQSKMSPFSPSKARSFPLQSGLLTSSPLRQTQTSSHLQPYTPNYRSKTLKAPPPIPSPSPNTNLRLHRSYVDKMLRTPLRHVPGVDANYCSPMFSLNEYAEDATPLRSNTLFPLHNADLLAGDIHGMPSLSPIPPQHRRPRLDRSISTSAIKDTRSGLSIITSVPALAFPDPLDLKLDTPSRVFDFLGSPSKVFDDESPSKDLQSSAFDLLSIPAIGLWPSLQLDPSTFLSTEGDFQDVDIAAALAPTSAAHHHLSQPQDSPVTKRFALPTKHIAQEKWQESRQQLLVEQPPVPELRIPSAVQHQQSLGQPRQQKRNDEDLEPCYDIFKGFRQIGAKSNTSKGFKAQKPVFARSVSSFK